MSRSGVFQGSFKLDEQIGTGASGVITLTVPTSPIYRALEIVLTGRSNLVTVTNDTCRLTLNGDTTAANYWYQFIMGNGATASAAENIGSNAYIFAGHFPAAGSTTNVEAESKIWLPNYAGGSLKTVDVHAGGTTHLATGGMFNLRATGVWKSTAVITSVVLTLAAGQWLTTSKATLWGLA